MQRIEDYALLGDLQTAALVAGTARSTGCACRASTRRRASRRCSATRTPGSGGSRRPAGRHVTRRRYRGDSLCWRRSGTRPTAPSALIDTMPPRGEAPDVVRVVEGVTGRVPMRMALRLRFDYGHIVPWVRQVDGDLVAVAGPDAVWLSHAGGTARPRPDDRRGVHRARRRSGCRSCSPTARRTCLDPRRSTPTARWPRPRQFWSDWMSRLQLRRPLAGGRPPVAGRPSRR